MRLDNHQQPSTREARSSHRLGRPVVPYLAALVYVAVGLYRWHRERHDIEREGLLSLVLWTLTEDLDLIASRAPGTGDYSASDVMRCGDSRYERPSRRATLLSLLTLSNFGLLRTEPVRSQPPPTLSFPM